MFLGESSGRCDIGGTTKLDKKKLALFMIGLTSAGILAFAFAQSVDAIKCEPDNARWVSGPLGSMAKACDTPDNLSQPYQPNKASAPSTSPPSMFELFR